MMHMLYFHLYLFVAQGTLARLKYINRKETAESANVALAVWQLAGKSEPV